MVRAALRLIARLTFSEAPLWLTSPVTSIRCDKPEGWAVHFDEPLGQGKAQARSFRVSGHPGRLDLLELQEDPLGLLCMNPPVLYPRRQSPPTRRSRIGNLRIRPDSSTGGLFEPCQQWRSMDGTEAASKTKDGRITLNRPAVP